jgi:hypothetical protein
MLLPIACLTRVTSLSLAGAVPIGTMLGVGAYVLFALSLGAAVLLRLGWLPVAGCVAASIAGFAIGGHVGDPFLMAVPIVVAPLALATLALDPPPHASLDAAD